MSRYTTNNLLGIVLMMLAMLLFEVMDAVAKWLLIADMSAIQVIAIRSWMILAMVPLILVVRGELAELRIERPVQHLLRGMLGFLAPFCFFTSLKILPLADATVVFFSAAFFLTAASALVLKEQVGIHRWGAVVVGFSGVVIAMDPQGGAAVGSYLLALCGAVVYAFIFIWGKQLSKRDSVISLVLSLHLGMGVSACLLLPWVWVPVSAEMLGMLLLMAVIALIAHFIFTLAFARADVSVLAPFEYTALIWATIIGYVIWLDFPSPRVWSGAVIIIGCGLYVIHRESLHHKSLKNGVSR
ncbi:MAG: DMT family transporter [Gammaproteobacteria bacterium]|nr:DMT family transporter [Gammaproteobacteria bacterium]